MPHLYRRVVAAVREAERVIARSRALASQRTARGDDGVLARRCAWCGRFSLGEEWMPGSELPQLVPSEAAESATHTICPDCSARLVREGKSHAPDDG